MTHEEFKVALDIVLDEMRDYLIAKNRRYGNSALEPVRVFSKASPREQLLVRMDDKLSRIRSAQDDDDEDPYDDLLGYLVLDKIHRRDWSAALDTSMDEPEEDAPRISFRPKGGEELPLDISNALTLTKCQHNEHVGASPEALGTAAIGLPRVDWESAAIAVEGKKSRREGL